jgi:hypothetical protein
MVNKTMLFSGLVVTVCACTLLGGVIDSHWIAVDDGLWNQADNWDPPLVPDNAGANSFNVTIDGDGVSVQLHQRQIVNRLDCFGEVELFGEGWNILSFAGQGLFNHGDLEISDLLLDGNVTNVSGGYLELEDLEIFGELYNDTGAFLEIWDEVEINRIVNHGTIISHPGGDLYTEEDHFINNGQITLFGGQCGVEGETAVFQNQTDAVISGWGNIYCFDEATFINQGTVKAQHGVLRLVNFSAGLTNEGLFSAAPSSSLQIKLVGNFTNAAMISTAAGDVVVEGVLVNESGAEIGILDGLLSATAITQKAGAVFNAFGKIVTENGFHLDSDAVAAITGPTSLIGDLTIDAGATLQIKDGQTLITGQTTNNGTIHVIGGTVIFQGGYAGTGTILTSAGTDRNHFDVNSDAEVNFQDFVHFAENWLWKASWYE